MSEAHHDHDADRTQDRGSGFETSGVVPKLVRFFRFDRRGGKKPIRALSHLALGAVVFPIALAAGALLHLEAVPRAHRLLLAEINRTIASLFVGRLTIDRIGQVGFGGIDGVEAHVIDGRGVLVARVSGVRVRLPLGAALRATLAAAGALGANSPVVIELPSLFIAEAEANLDADDESGSPRIALAFAPRKAADPHPPPAAPARAFNLKIDRIHLVRGHFDARPSAPHDGDVEEAEATLAFESGAFSRISIDLVRAKITANGLPEGAHATGFANGHFERASPGDLSLHAAWDGRVGAVEETARLSLMGDRLDAQLDIRRGAPNDVRAVFASWPLAGETTVHIEAHGTLPRVDVSARAAIGSADGHDGLVDVAGPVAFGPAVHAAFHLQVHGIDGRSFDPPQPFSRASGEGDVKVALRPTGAASAHIDFALAGAAWSAVPVPPAQLTADVERTPAGDTTMKAEIAVNEPGAPIDVNLQIAPKDGAPVLAFQVDVSARLENVPRLGGAASGSARALCSGTVNLKTRAIDAALSATSYGLHTKGASFDDARLEAHLGGTVGSPSANVAVAGEGVSFGPVRLSGWRGQGRLSTAGAISVRGFDLALAGEGNPVNLRAELLRWSDGALRVDNAVAEGLGEPLFFAAEISPSSVTVNAESAGFDLARLSSFVPLGVRGGRLSADIHVTVGSQAAEGRVRFDLSRGLFGDLGETNAHVEAMLHGRHVSGEATASIADIGSLEIHAPSVDVAPGPISTLGPWRNAWGAADFVADADLAKIASHLPAGALAAVHIDHVGGRLALSARFGRDSENDMTPGLDLAAHTAGLSLAFRGVSGPRRVDGADADFHAFIDGDTGAATLSSHAHDPVGVLLDVDARSSDIPYANLLSGLGLRDALLTTPFEAHVAVPARPIETLPAAFGAGLRGKLGAQIDWRGAVTEPSVDMTASLSRGDDSPSAMALPVDLALTAHYDGARLRTSVLGRARRRQALDLEAIVDARAADWLAAGDGAEMPWTASAHAKIDQLPLRSIAVLDERQVRGSASGEIDLVGLHDDARATALVGLSGLQVGDVACKQASLNVSIDGRAFDASVAIDQSAGGSLRAAAHAATHWGRAALPALDISQPARGSLTAKELRATLLLPFLSRTLTRLDGRIDGSADILIDPMRASARTEATIALAGGVFELPSVGGEFHDVSAKLAMTPDGIVRLSDAVAFGVTGRLAASATARMNGFSVESVRAVVQVPASAPLPLVFDGVELGMLDGRFDLSMNRDAAGNDFVIQVPRARVALPAGSTARTVQKLGEMDNFTTGVKRSGRTFVPVSLGSAGRDPAALQGSSTAKISIQLGSDVEISRGADLDVRLEGQPTVTMGSTAHVSGQLRLLHGSLRVMGKPFEIEKGTVTFVGDDPSNPQVVLEAGWAAPDGTRVYADFVGPLSSGKVTLRSEPSRPQSEIVALLFGATDNAALGNAQVTGVAAGAAGGMATQPINDALGGVNHALDGLGLGGGISANVDTSTANPRPEVEVQIARDISVQVAWVLGAIPPGTNPDSTLVTLNWNFLRKWSLATTVGDQGTTILDVIWQHRY